MKNAKKGTLKTTKWDIIDHLKTEEDIAEYMSQVMADGDPEEMLAAINDVTRARGMTQVAHDSGLTRASLYKAFAPGAKPQFETIRRVMDALGIAMTFHPKSSLAH